METPKKHSRKRDAILACIRETASHPSAEWVYARLKPDIPDLSLATVYRNINMFRREGMVISVGTVNGLERFDGNVEPHVHFVCQRCGKVEDIFAIPAPTELIRQAAEHTKAKVTGCTLSFTGLCEDCGSCGEGPLQ